jgi:predicted nucleic acid-binding protein
VSIVSDASPLVVLAKADLLALLEALYSEVLVPPGVHDELRAKSGPESARLTQALGLYIRVSTLPAISPSLYAVLANLGEGERQAIALAHDSGVPLLVDDLPARTAAHQLGLKVTGTAGVLVRAKTAGLIPHVRAVLEAMRQEGCYFSDELIETAARLAGE